MHRSRLGLSKLLAYPVAVMTLAAAAAWCAAPSAAQDQPIVPMLLCPFGCGNTEGYAILGNLVARGEEPITLAPQETPGYMYNVRAMTEERRWPTTVFGTEDTIILLAPKGGHPEIAEFLPEPIDIDFKLLFGEAFWAQGKYFLTYDPEIKTPADLKGKRIAVGLRTQSDFGFFARLILADGYGVTPENSDIRHVNPPIAVQQLIDGAVDAAVAAFATEPERKEWLVSGPLRQIEAAGRPVRYIGVDQEAIDRVNEKWNTGFLTAEVPVGTLPLQEEAFMTGLNRGYMAAHTSFSDETAYQLVMAVAKYGPQMGELHGLWKLWSPAMMLHGLADDNVHPGAKRAYEELGWWDEHEKYPPVEFGSQQ